MVHRGDIEPVRRGACQACAVRLARCAAGSSLVQTASRTIGHAVFPLLPFHLSTPRTGRFFRPPPLWYYACDSPLSHPVVDPAPSHGPPTRVVTNASIVGVHRCSKPMRSAADAHAQMQTWTRLALTNRACRSIASSTAAACRRMTLSRR